MNYYVARNGQTYGPYNEETIRKYVSDGSMSVTDMGRTDAMPNWAPLGQVLGLTSAPQPGVVPSGANVPPSLPWAAVLLIAVFTSGIFITIWGLIQANWVRSIDPKSRAMRDLVIGIIFPIVGVVVGGILLVTGGATIQFDSLFLLGASTLASAFLVFFGLTIGGFLFHVKAFFGIRDSMERYYNSTEPIQLRLSVIMTLLFNVLYLQYHMSRIADWKRTGILRP